MRAGPAMVAAASLVVTIASAWAMSGRVSEFNAGRVRFVFRAVVVREFAFAGRPVTLSDERSPEGVREVVLRYGPEGAARESRFRVPSSASIDDRESTLARHADWLKVLRFVPLTGGRAGDLDRRIDEGAIKDRLVVVARAAPETGDAMADLAEFRARPRFRYVELIESGETVESARWYAAEGDELGPAEERLTEGTWEYDAALSVRPMRGKPKARFSDNAVGAMGWTLPAAFLSMLAFAVSLAFALAGRVATERPT